MEEDCIAGPQAGKGRRAPGAPQPGGGTAPALAGIGDDTERVGLQEILFVVRPVRDIQDLIVPGCINTQEPQVAGLRVLQGHIGVDERHVGTAAAGRAFCHGSIVISLASGRLFASGRPGRRLAVTMKAGENDLQATALRRKHWGL